MHAPTTAGQRFHVIELGTIRDEMARRGWTRPSDLVHAGDLDSATVCRIFAGRPVAESTLRKVAEALGWDEGQLEQLIASTVVRSVSVDPGVLNAKRRQRGWSQGQLARASRSDKCTISHIARGLRCASPAVVERIAGALGVEAEELIA